MTSQIGPLCLEYKHLPTHNELIAIAMSESSKCPLIDTNLKKQCEFLFGYLVKLYGALGIPIISRTTFRRKYNQTLKMYRKSVKRPEQREEKLKEIFPFALCSCLISAQSHECSCDKGNSIPEPVLEFFIDQCEPRKYSLMCDCINDHRIRIWNIASKEYHDHVILHNSHTDEQPIAAVELNASESSMKSNTDESVAVQNIPDLNDSMRSLSLTPSSLNITHTSNASDEEYLPDQNERIMLVPEKAKPIPSSLSKLNFSGVCEVADRLGMSESGLSNITNSVLELVGWVTPVCKRLVTTPTFMRKVLTDERAKTWQDEKTKRVNNVQNIQCFSFDGKKAKNAVFSENRYGKTSRKRTEVIMENVAIVRQPEMEALGFISTLKATSENIFNEIWKFLNPNDQKFDSLIAIGADGTNTNTGCNAGIITLFEARIGRNLHWLICLLHLNELNIKYMIFDVDGCSKSRSKLSGPIGKLISEEKFTITNIAEFRSIPAGETFSSIDNIIEHSRGDQRHMLELSQAVASGHCTDAIAFKKPPPFPFVRWTSAAIKLLLLYISLENPTHDLISLVTYVQYVYIPMWLRVRFQDSWDHGSRHIYALLDSARKAAAVCDNEELARVTMGVIINNGYYSHSENVLLSMITDIDPQIRKIGYARILKIRAANGQSTGKLRKFEKPQQMDYNFDATEYYNVLNEDKFVHEPPYTQKIHVELLEEYALENRLLSVPSFKCHTQETERVVALMNKSVTRVCGMQNQNAIMKHTARSRQRNVLITKRSYRTHEESMPPIKKTISRPRHLMNSQLSHI